MFDQEPVNNGNLDNFFVALFAYGFSIFNKPIKVFRREFSIFP